MTAQERMHRLTVRLENGCIVRKVPARWYWHFWYFGKMHLAHRVAFEISRGEIPAEKVLNHLCRNKACVNPFHLSVVSQSENLLYDYSAKPWGNQNTSKTYCIRGHSLTGGNLYVSKGKRYCRICKNAWKREARANGSY